MRKKTIYIFGIMLFALLMFSVKVEAAFQQGSSGNGKSAEEICSINEGYIEICKAEPGSPAYAGPKKISRDR